MRSTGNGRDDIGGLFLMLIVSTMKYAMQSLLGVKMTNNQLYSWCVYLQTRSQYEVMNLKYLYITKLSVLSFRPSMVMVIILNDSIRKSCRYKLLNENE